MGPPTRHLARPKHGVGVGWGVFLCRARNHVLLTVLRLHNHAKLLISIVMACYLT